MSKAVLLDRDGTINVDHGYLHDPALLELLPGVVEALTKLAELDYLLILITNQSGIGRGYFTEDKYVEFNQALISALEQQGIKIAATYMCPHAPEEECTCRKPKPYMALRAIEDFGIEVSESYMFGDKASDVACGEAAGLTSRLIKGEQDVLYWTNEIIEKRL